MNLVEDINLTVDTGIDGITQMAGLDDTEARYWGVFDKCHDMHQVGVHWADMDVAHIVGLGVQVDMPSSDVMAYCNRPVAAADVDMCMSKPIQVHQIYLFYS